MEQSNQLKLIYGLYLAGLVVGITPLIGVVMAYMSAGDGPEWTQSHYGYQIRTFWIGVLYWLVSTLLTLVLIGFVLLFVVAIWYIARNVKGLLAANKEQALEDPGSWLI